MRQLENGDVANILHNVRWQKDLFRTLPRLAETKCAPELIEKSESFIQAYGVRQTSNRDFPDLVRTQLDYLTEVARSLQDRKLLTLVEAIEQNLGELVKLQKAHRDFLLRLDELSRG